MAYDNLRSISSFLSLPLLISLFLSSLIEGGRIKVAITDASKLSLLKNIHSLTKLEPELHAASLKEIGQFIVRLDKGDKANVQIENMEKKLLKKLYILVFFLASLQHFIFR